MKRILMLLCCAVFIFVCSIVVYAHPGRTDSNGGHTDSSTGEYHYHHGYSAHDHYDMDGDGVIDCPYDFDDKTGQGSGSQGSISGNHLDEESNYNNNDTPIASNNLQTLSIQHGFIFGITIFQFVLINVLARKLDNEDPVPDPPCTPKSRTISVVSTFVVFGVIFAIQFVVLSPITWIPLTWGDVWEIVLLSFILCNPVFLVASYISMWLTYFLCKRFQTEQSGCYFRLSWPLSFVLTIISIIAR